MHTFEAAFISVPWERSWPLHYGHTQMAFGQSSQNFEVNSTQCTEFLHHPSDGNYDIFKRC